MTKQATAEAQARERLREREAKENVQSGSAWLETNFRRVQAFFEQPLIHDFVLEPFTSIFDTSGTVTDRQVHKLITQVALANAAMAAVPGSMGLGVTVAIGLELFMALRIAQLLGFRVNSPTEILKSFTLGVGALVGALYVFRAIWGVVYAALAFIPVGGTFVTFMASYLTTLALGILYWVAFQELAKSRETLTAIGNREWQEVFRASLKRARGTIVTTGMHHARLLRGLVNPRTVRVVFDRARAYFSGELVADTPRVRGDLFVPLAMAALLARQAERLDGPMGAMFLDSVRQAHPQLADATLDQMADYFGQYDASQIDGVLAALRGQMFERMVEAAENADGDLWSAALHDDRNVPGSDIVFTHQDTGETIEISLKATDSASYLEEALRRYPDIPIVTTDEIAGILDHEPLVSASGISNADVRTITEENFEEMLAETPSIEAGIGGGIALSAFAALYPFLVARGRGRIDGDQLKRAVQRVTGDASQRLIVRLSFAAMLGPILGWYLLARGGGAIVNAAEALADESERLPVRTHRVTLATRPTPAAP